MVFDETEFNRCIEQMKTEMDKRGNPFILRGGYFPPEWDHKAYAKGWKITRQGPNMTFEFMGVVPNGN